MADIFGGINSAGAHSCGAFRFLLIAAVANFSAGLVSESKAGVPGYSEIASSVLDDLATDLAMTRLEFGPEVSPVQESEGVEYVDLSRLDVATTLEISRDHPSVETFTFETSFRADMPGAKRNWLLCLRAGSTCTNLRTGEVIQSRGAPTIVGCGNLPASIFTIREIAEAGTYAVSVIVMGQHTDGQWKLLDVQHRVIRTMGDISGPRRYVSTPPRMLRKREDLSKVSVSGGTIPEGGMYTE